MEPSEAESGGPPGRKLVLALALLGALSAALWLAGLRVHQATEVYFVAFFVYLIAAALVVRAARGSRGALGVVVVGAILFRVIALAHDPQLSDDVYRYVWDGRVQAAGINPYLYAPDAPDLAGLRDPLWERVNHKSQPTPYPPLSQGLFALVYRLAPDSVRAMQVTAAVLDLLVGAALWPLLRRRGLPPERALIWLWNPATVLHFAHSGHNDVLMLLPLLLALALAERCPAVGSLGDGAGRPPPTRRPAVGAVGPAAAASAVWLGLAVLAKLLPLLLAPLFLRRWGLLGLVLFGVTIAAGYLPFLAAGPALLGGITTEGGEAIFNDGAFWLIRQAMKPLSIDPVSGAKLVAAAALAALALWLGWRTRAGRDLVPHAYTLIGAYVALSAVVEPWYATWLLPFVALTLAPGRALGFAAGPALGWLLFSGLVEVSDFTYRDPDIPYLWTWVRATEWLPLAALAAWPRLHRLRPGRESKPT